MQHIALTRGKASMDFIFMLTRRDRTVEDCLDVFELIRPLGLRHVGFKDVGVDFRTLAELTRRIRASGATVYMEVVSTSPEAALQSVRNALELGVDRLLGGTSVDEVMTLVEGSEIAYFPFPGFPDGHPTRLGGTPADIERHCRSFMARGCAGADLLAYRATEADPVELVRAARRGLGQGRLIVAGSIDSAERIRTMAEAGADAFTIGSAVFDGSYAPYKGSILTQLAAVLADCRAVESAS
jgi:hypothetical protein